MDRTGLTGRLREAVIGLAARAGDLRTATELRRTVTDFVERLRQAGDPPERVLASVKSVAHSVTGSFDRDVEREITGQLVRWTIEAYYNAE
jgi:hypothetical protein